MSDNTDVISELIRAALDIKPLGDNATEREKDERLSAQLRLNRLEVMVRELLVNAKLYTYDDEEPTS